MRDVSAGAVWSLLRRAAVLEVRLYVSLVRWVARRRDLGGPEDRPVGYARLVTPVMWLWIFGSAVEIPVVHLLVPWDGVRVALLVVSVWGLLWMVGMLASLYVYPHLVGPDGLRIRYGALHDVRVPWAAVAAVHTRSQTLDSSMWVLVIAEADEGTNLNVAVSGEVNVHLELREPTVISTAKGEVVATRVSFLADDPRAVVRQVKDGIATRR